MSREQANPLRRSRSEGGGMSMACHVAHTPARQRHNPCVLSALRATLLKCAFTRPDARGCQERRPLRVPSDYPPLKAPSPMSKS